MDKRILWIGGIILAVIALIFWNTAQGQTDGHANAGGNSESPAAGAALVDVNLPAELSSLAKTGEMAFNSNCAVCHGENAAGLDGSGPPLVHVIYEPNHHGDQAFFVAVQNGVRAHHWRFGNMAPIDGLTRGDVKAIIAYVRELQRENGIN